MNRERGVPRSGDRSDSWVEVGDSADAPIRLQSIGANA